MSSTGPQSSTYHATCKKLKLMVFVFSLAIKSTFAAIPMQIGRANNFDRKSTSGYAFILMSAPISWKSKKQSSVSLSTSEAEYIALSLAVQEGKWTHHLLSEILDAACEPGPELKIFEDNQSFMHQDGNGYCQPRPCKAH